MVAWHGQDLHKTEVSKKNWEAFAQQWATEKHIFPSLLPTLLSSIPNRKNAHFTWNNSRDFIHAKYFAVSLL